MIGQTISHYRIVESLGAGGMGEVYLADDTKLDRKVALKFLPSSLWNVAEAQQRLMREARAASKLDHPNVVTIYGIEEFEGKPFIIMAYVRGSTLKQYCTSTHRTIDELIGLALQMADGIQHAHDAGVIHRDLKPGNIMVDERGRVRVLDFGIASLRGAARLTQTGSTVGTLAYAPPEMAQGQDATAASDIYSLGVVMYQMLTERLPFDADHEAGLLYSILNEQPRPMRESRKEIPSGLEKLVLRCLEKKPSKRFANCTELAKELQRFRAQTAIEPETAASTAKPSIAVLPFTNMSADPENEYFSDGLSEELLNVLAKNPGLKVTGRTSSFAFKGKREDLREIGHKLGVETLLEGSVRRAGSRVRITAQLVNVTDGFHLWSETYDRMLDDIFAVQDDIAKSVSTAMNVTLLGMATPAKQVNVESYNLYLQGMYFAQRFTEEAAFRAEELFRRALAINSDDARAWAGLSRVYAIGAGYGFRDVAEGHALAREAALRALAIDDNLADAHEMMGWIYMSFEFAWDKAEQEFRRAISLAPGDSRMSTGLATIAATRDRAEEASRLARRAVELDPLDPIAHKYLGRIQWWCGQLDAARESYRRALELSPGLTSVHAILAGIDMQQGRLDDAMVEAMKEKKPGYRCCSLAIIHHARGEPAKSEAALGELLKEGDQWAFQFAMVYAFRGENDRAFEWLERAFTLHDSGIHSIRLHDVFTNLHSDPRWPKFLEKIGLAD